MKRVLTSIAVRSHGFIISPLQIDIPQMQSTELTSTLDDLILVI